MSDQVCLAVFFLSSNGKKGEKIACNWSFKHGEGVRMDEKQLLFQEGNKKGTEIWQFLVVQ